MPGLDGWEATRLLKTDPATSHLTVVALSAHALAAEGDRAKRAGCDGFIAKPCLPQELVEQMAAYLRVQTEPAQRQRRARGTAELNSRVLLFALASQPPSAK